MNYSNVPFTDAETLSFPDVILVSVMILSERKENQNNPKIKQIRATLEVYRSSHRRCSVKKDVLKNFANFTGNTCVGTFFK